ncbi:MAG: hypothetical protein ACIAS6_09915 [Phycisphaerales bacterium JB060]
MPKDPAEYRFDLSTSPSLAVGLDQIVVLGSHRMTMFDKSAPIVPGSPQDTRRWGPVSYEIAPNDYPFRPAGVNLPSIDLYYALMFPEAAYDPITGHVWMLYAEGVDTESDDPVFKAARQEVSGSCFPRLHVAASRSPAFTNFNRRLPGIVPPAPDPAGFTYWTDDAPISPDPTGVMGGQALRLDLLFTEYEEEGGHAQVNGSFLYPSIGFETDDVIITGVEPGQCATPFTDQVTTGTQTILFVPREFAGASGMTTIHDGGRINEDDIVIAKTTALDIPDDSYHTRIVQEPYEQWENVTLMISNEPVAFGGLIQNIRLKGVFKGDQGVPVPTPGDSDWRIRQSLTLSGTDFVLDDMSISPLDLGPITGAGLPQLLYPTTPVPSFTPTMIDESFTTAVMARDNQGNPRVFAASAGIDQSTSLWAVQWYVIDPDLGPEVVPATTPVTYQHFHSPLLLSTTWSPTIIAKGRITSYESEVAAGHCYHPVIGVTRTGRLYVEYTFSSPTVDQRIVRAQIDNSYGGVAAYEQVEFGPSLGYGEVDDRWALYGDMQADPEFCRFWSTHTLAEDNDEREVWLFKKPYNCFQTDMNLDGTTDTYDMMLFTDYYTAGDERADTNADGQIDSTDMADYLSAYDAATGP